MPPAREACVALARTWRQRRDLRDAYSEHADRVEQELRLAGARFSLEAIRRAETFRRVECCLQQEVAAALLAEPSEELVELAQARQASFWSQALPEAQSQWPLIAIAGQILLEANRVEKAVQAAPDAAAIVAAYTQGERPWCLLDTHHRHLEQRQHQFEFGASGAHRELEQVIARALDRYSRVGSNLAEAFLRRYQAEGFRLPGLLRQRQIHQDRVKPALAEGKVAYVWVDALRYEMARELAELVAADFETGLEPALASVPTITPIGMASLLPLPGGSLPLVKASGGKVALQLEGKAIRERQERMDTLRAQAGGPFCETHLSGFLPKPAKALGDEIRAARLTVVTSQEIDAQCEGSNVTLAHDVMDKLLGRLRRALRMLSELGVQRIVVAADHGYVFADEVGSDMIIDAPGGQTVELHRRAWIGNGGAADPACMRAKLADLGWECEWDIVVPWNLACFRSMGGAKAYFHGGMSPQEILIPVLTLTPRQAAESGAGREVEWELLPGSAKITTRFISVQVRGTVKGLFELAPPRVRVEVRAGNEVISQPVSASYGFEEATRDVQLRAAGDDPRSLEVNSVALQITKDVAAGEASIHMLDATTGAELARREGIALAISL